MGSGLAARNLPLYADRELEFSLLVNVEGAIYLDSCRVPTDSELQTIDACLAEGRHRGSEEFFGCLRAAGVKIGCEEQADGARICY